ncbi:uncharacterized protein LOC127704146 isoform X1 [Mytilus californianus]|uniref:uncharacterized protein LOC127704146 isoform X1 n=1 Tax=Mytilus californianus TaxID=6549 RepID=UPI0022452486|nr:uncharacterized protein LOC127704146 isoform X1 [Mytilus californianus]XP_052063993.1 uncharacterized protein LOC127704146 isoform X1 [Mytilus californianus]
MASNNEGKLCPPFCYVDCKTKHHPIIVEMVNVKRTDTDFSELDKLIKTFDTCEENGGWDVSADIPDPNLEYRLTMLHWAAALGKVELVKWLLRNKMCLPKYSGDGHTVLHKMIELLQENKDIAFHEIGNIINELLAIFWKDSLTVKNKDGNMPLHMCCLPLQDNISKSKQAYYISWIYSIITRFKKSYRYKGDYPKLSYIVNSVNDNGDTPVHILARFSKNYNTIQFMLEPVHFDFGLKNNEGMTALDVAFSCGNEKISTMLIKIGKESMEYSNLKKGTEQPVCQNTRFSQQQTELIRKITRTKSTSGNDRTLSSTADHDMKISPNHKPNEGCLKIPSSPCSSSHVYTKTSPESKKGLIKPKQMKVSLSPSASHEKKEDFQIKISSRSENISSTSLSANKQERSDCRIKSSPKSEDLNNELTRVTSTSNAINNADSVTQMKNSTPAHVCNIKRYEDWVGPSPVDMSKGNDALILQDINVSEKSDSNYGNNLCLPLDSNNQITGKVPEPAQKKKQKVYYAIKGNQIHITDSLGSPSDSFVDSLSVAPGYVPKNVPIVLRGKNARMKRVASFPLSGTIHQGIHQLKHKNIVSHVKKISTENNQSSCTDNDDNITQSKNSIQSSDFGKGVPWSRQTFCVIPASKASDFLASKGLLLKQSIPSTVKTWKSSECQEDKIMSVNKIPKENVKKSINSESHSKTLPKPNTTMSTIVDKFLNTRYSDESNSQHVSDMTVSQTSPQITVVSSTSNGCKRKDITSVSSSCNDKDHPIKYIKIEDDDSVEMEVSLADQRALSNTSPFQSLSSQSSTCSIDSDHGNGKGIMSYLSMCSENTKHDFLETLYKDRDRYMDEKDNLEKQYKEVCVKCESNMETVASRNSILKYHLDKVKQLQTEIHELTDQTMEMSEVKNKLAESKLKVEKKLETCENAISDFKSMP